MLNWWINRTSRALIDIFPQKASHIRNVVIRSQSLEAFVIAIVGSLIMNSIKKLLMTTLRNTEPVMLIHRIHNEYKKMIITIFFIKILILNKIILHMHFAYIWKHHNIVINSIWRIISNFSSFKQIFINHCKLTVFGISLNNFFLNICADVNNCNYKIIYIFIWLQAFLLYFVKSGNCISIDHVLLKTINDTDMRILIKKLTSSDQSEILLNCWKFFERDAHKNIFSQFVISVYFDMTSFFDQVPLSFVLFRWYLQFSILLDSNYIHVWRAFLTDIKLIF